MQAKLIEGTSDKKTDCMYCSAYWPNGEGVFRCRFIDDIDPPHKCPKCGYCDCFRPITDEDAMGWLSKDVENGGIRKTTFNRWKWINLIE